ncbi:MAG: class I SAM-dependent methyltransferase [Candidatus Methanofastidiosa archaeon]|nr:class I SAM-dependent methyltransferase [Candidatus Methanofastidiosa archaeon]
MEHYYSSHPSTDHDVEEIDEYFGNHNFHFSTDSGVFSKGKMDKGTRLLLESLPPLTNERALDLGCGWGAIGIILSKLYPMADIHLSDINPRAVSLAKKNAKANQVSVTLHKSDMFENIELSFDMIVTNPPIRAGKETTYAMIKEGHGHLNDGGTFFSVVRTKQGAKSYGEELERVFGNAEIVNRGGGYKVFKAIKDESR